jgi:hypothetical protein
MANTNGGTIYIGLSDDPKEKIVGVRDPAKSIDFLYSAISRHLSPDPEVSIDSLVSQGKTVVRVVVPSGRDLPYAIDDNRFYVRDESETTLAVRDEIVRLVERRLKGETTLPIEQGEGLELEQAEKFKSESQIPELIKSSEEPVVSAPRTGVEIVASEERNGTIYHTVRDLRNGNLINNVTKSSSRKLWHYAISQVESGIPDPEDIEWHGNIALIDERRRDNRAWYDLAMRDDEGIHVYYGVTDSGLNEEWLELVGE